MHRVAAIWVSAVLSLAGCGEKKTPEETVTVVNEETGDVTTATISNEGEAARYDIQSSSGETATITMGGTEAPPNLPAYAPVYPAAKILSTLQGEGGDGTGAIVIMATKDEPGRVAAFYQSRFKEAGLAQTVDASTAAGRMLAAAEAEGDGTVTVMIAPAENGQTQVQLHYAAGRAPIISAGE